MTTYRIDTDQVWCGCRRGITLDAFRAAVRKTHAEGTVFRAEYEAAIVLLESLRAIYAPEAESES
jgi:hypothetical protein